MTVEIIEKHHRNESCFVLGYETWALSTYCNPAEYGKRRCVFEWLLVKWLILSYQSLSRGYHVLEWAARNSLQCPSLSFSRLSCLELIDSNLSASQNDGFPPKGAGMPERKINYCQLSLVKHITKLALTMKWCGHNRASYSPSENEALTYKVVRVELKQSPSRTVNVYGEAEN